MIKPDIIVSWPRNADYPLWRQWIWDNRGRFAKVIVVFTETNFGRDFKPFVRTSMAGPDNIFLDSPPIYDIQDWRDVAVNTGLNYSDSEMVLFTEQDFFPKDGFYDVLDNAWPYHDVFAAYDGARMHPCFILSHRHVIDRKTSRNFGIVPGKSDHFYLIQQQLESADVSIYKIPSNLYHHMAGLSSNFSLMSIGKAPNHKLEEFNKYLGQCLQVDVALEPEWVRLVSSYLYNR